MLNFCFFSLLSKSSNLDLPYLQHCSPNKSSGHSNLGALEDQPVRELQADQERQGFQVGLRDPACQGCPDPEDLKKTYKLSIIGNFFFIVKKKKDQIEKICRFIQKCLLWIHLPGGPEGPLGPWIPTPGDPFSPFSPG